MISKVVVFEDNEQDQNKFREVLERVGCKVLVVGTHRADEHRANIMNFAPQAAVVDSQFVSDVDGTDVIAFLRKHLPSIPIVVCSALYNSKRDWLLQKYQDAPGVCV